MILHSQDGASPVMDFPEYELAGIETIARGVCIQSGKVLLCRAKGGATTYLPGGHIEFGETGRQALVREIKEEMDVDATAGVFLGVVENQFRQHGKPHAEINLVYRLTLPEGTAATAQLLARHVRTRPAAAPTTGAGRGGPGAGRGRASRRPRKSGSTLGASWRSR